MLITYKLLIAKYGLKARVSLEGFWLENYIRPMQSRELGFRMHRLCWLKPGRSAAEPESMRPSSW